GDPRGELTICQARAADGDAKARARADEILQKHRVYLTGRVLDPEAGHVTASWALGWIVTCRRASSGTPTSRASRRSGQRSSARTARRTSRRIPTSATSRSASRRGCGDLRRRIRDADVVLRPDALVGAAAHDGDAVLVALDDERTIPRVDGLRRLIDLLRRDERLDRRAL